MKSNKIFTLVAAVAAMLGTASCDTPAEPVMQAPTEFKLNVPPFAQQYYELAEGGVLELTCSQPDYGIGTAVDYSAEISLTEDFAQSKPISNVNGASATISLDQSEIAVAICEMLGVVDEDTWQQFASNPVTPLYIRAIAQVGDYGWSRIVSNVVELPRVQYYYALKTPGFIFMTGIPSFIEPKEANRDEMIRLYEADDAIGSQVYSAVVKADPGKVAFRFYTKLSTGWDAAKDFSIGAGEADMTDVNISDKFEDGVYNGDVVMPGRSNWTFDWAGGEMTITVDLKKLTITIAAGDKPVVTTKYVYMVGNQFNASWKEPNADNEALFDNWKLVCSDGSGVYTATFELGDLSGDKNNLYCRFYQALTGWGAAQWAAVSNNYAVTPGVAADTQVGEDCFMLEEASNSKVSISLDTKANKVTFDFVD